MGNFAHAVFISAFFCERKEVRSHPSTMLRVAGREGRIRCWGGEILRCAQNDPPSFHPSSRLRRTRKLRRAGTCRPHNATGNGFASQTGLHGKPQSANHESQPRAAVLHYESRITKPLSYSGLEHRKIN